MKVLGTYLLVLLTSIVWAQDYYNFDLEYEIGNVPSNTFSIGDFSIDWNA